MFSIIPPLRVAGIEDTQCTAVMRTGRQCEFAAEEGQLHCRRHRLISPTKRFEYALGMNMPGIPRDQIFDLTAEVQLLKQLIAARLALVKDSNTLILYSGHLADLITRLHKLTDGALALEIKKDELLPKEKALALIGTVMAVVADEVVDVDIIDRIHDRLALLLEGSPSKNV